MRESIEYRILDRGCILRRCLHAGPVPLRETDPDYSAEVPAETRSGAPRGAIDRFLKALCERYGAYGIAALDGDMIVGQVRFYPTVLQQLLGRRPGAVILSTCVQQHDEVWAIGQADVADLPAKDSLSPRSLRILCFQLVNDYRAMAEGRPTDQPSYLYQGIGTTLLEKTIEWARANGWDEIRDQAIPHIPPLMTWSCHLSVERYRRLGFRIARSAERLDGPVSQRQGYHGDAMKRMWEPYAHMPDEEVSALYDVVLKTR